MSQFLHNFPRMKTLSIIIVNYNTKKLTNDCIASIVRTAADISYEIIVIDNASSEQFELRDSLKPKVRLIRNSVNKGFAKANNQGMKIARGEYILLLNSDTVVHKDAISLLISFAKSHPDAGIVAPQLLNADQSVQPSVFLFPTISRAILQYWVGLRKAFDKYIPKGNSPVKVEAVVAAAVLITPTALKKAGRLNEKYFMYFEDIDYCRKIKKAKLTIYYLPEAKVTHYHGASGKGIADSADQWRRLIPSSKIYHGNVRHFIITFILWSGQKLGRK